jgi:hypothetical protein
MTAGILISRKTKNALCSTSLHFPTIASKNAFKTFRNIYNTVIRNAKKAYFANELETNKSNLKKTWATLNRAINKPISKSSSCTSLLIDGSLTDDPALMAEHFNTFFATAAKKITDELHPTSKSPTAHIPTNPNKFSLNNSPVSDSEILGVTKLLLDKTSLDFNGISMAFIKKIIDVIVRPLRHIFTLSFASGCVPLQFKIAKVIPVFKSGDNSIMDNYRPISLLSNFSKILEKIVSSRLLFFLDTNNILTKWQFGFRPNHSTAHPMTHFMNFITETFNEKKHAVAIFCDLRKAFDTCNHEILLNKLEKYGISNIELQWFRCYLSNRKQFISIDGKNSSLLDVLLGVPQGSILGPLLFLIYINDLPLCSEFIALIFADDTTLLLSDSNIHYLINLANTEFQKICEFFRANRLALHPKKTQFMIFSNSPAVRAMNFEIVCNNNNVNEHSTDLICPIQRVRDFDKLPAVRFLGVFFDPNLMFKYPINTIRSTLSRALFALRSAKNILSTQSLTTLYFSIMHCHLIYAIQIWSSSSPNSYTSLFKLQKSAIRLITNSKYNAHTEPLFKQCKILPLPDLVNYFKIQFMHRFSQNFLPISFTDTWVRNNIRNIGDNEILLRNRNAIQRPFSRLCSTDHHPLTAFPKLWEDFPDIHIKFIRNKLEFDEKLKKYFLDELSATPNCGRLFCYSCSIR